MSKLFETTHINGMTLNNRFVRSATWEGMAEEDGTCTEKLIKLMAELAEGGVGLIITSHAYVQERGQAGPWQLGIYKDEQIPGLRKMTKAVHEQGGKIVMQLAHAGLYADTALTGEAPLAPSIVSGFTKTPPQELTGNEINKIVEAFGLAAKRAKSSGFDGVQIHAAHGYLMDQFLSPAYNRRQDKYGGRIENRVTALLEVLTRIRMHVEPNYPVLIKMNSRDFMHGGLELEDSVKAAMLLESVGLDAIEISGGTKESGKLNPVRTGIVSEDKEAYFKDAALAFREKIKLPLILVGGIRSFHIAQQIVDENIADYISMSRPLIREPGLIKRWQSGDYRKATCVSDSRCFLPIRSGKGMYCVVEKRLQDKKSKD
jgi:2,4-dienoyl-CoA reductase-like NADH-dependent reductase (Old Yellow Enzyme family)